MISRHSSGRAQEARLPLQDAGVELAEDGPDAVGVEAAHDVLGTLGMVELEAHDEAVLAHAHEEVGVERPDAGQLLGEEAGDAAAVLDHLRAAG